MPSAIMNARVASGWHAAASGSPLASNASRSFSYVQPDGPPPPFTVLLARTISQTARRRSAVSHSGSS